MLVNTQQQAVKVFTREGNAWRYKLFTTGKQVMLTSIHLTFDIAELYQQVNIANTHIPTND